MSLHGALSLSFARLRCCLHLQPRRRNTGYCTYGSLLEEYTNDNLSPNHPGSASKLSVKSTPLAQSPLPCLATLSCIGLIRHVSRSFRGFFLSVFHTNSSGGLGEVHIRSEGELDKRIVIVTGIANRLPYLVICLTR